MYENTRPLTKLPLSSYFIAE